MYMHCSHFTSDILNSSLHHKEKGLVTQPNYWDPSRNGCYYSLHWTPTMQWWTMIKISRSVNCSPVVSMGVWWSYLPVTNSLFYISVLALYPCPVHLSVSFCLLQYMRRWSLGTRLPLSMCFLYFHCVQNWLYRLCVCWRACMNTLAIVLYTWFRICGSSQLVTC